ncbi:hypothetical protein ACH5RR_000991 [Cinchona calisaya]|uniref:Uncharacterized protein n=1 Tax=Cinchona calisaya TaxID=153742 RepID=A0ABD3B263_9GENT
METLSSSRGRLKNTLLALIALRANDNVKLAEVKMANARAKFSREKECYANIIHEFELKVKDLEGKVFRQIDLFLRLT